MFNYQRIITYFLHDFHQQIRQQRNMNLINCLYIYINEIRTHSLLKIVLKFLKIVFAISLLNFGLKLFSKTIYLYILQGKLFVYLEDYEYCKKFEIKRHDFSIGKLLIVILISFLPSKIYWPCMCSLLHNCFPKIKINQSLLLLSY